jgi:hypothetical protein
MKKVLFAAIAALTLTGTAWASQHTDAVDLHFRTSVAANPTSVWDSLSCSRVGAQIAVLCTTSAVGTKYWSSPENTIAGDSTQFIQLHVFDQDGASCQSGADSLYIASQVSADGITWATAGTFVGGTAPTVVDRLDQTNVAGGFRGCLTLNGASLGKGAPLWKVTYYTKDLSSAQSKLEDCNLRMWPYIRFIIGFADVAGYKVKAKVQYFVTDN